MILIIFLIHEAKIRQYYLDISGICFFFFWISKENPTVGIIYISFIFKIWSKSHR